MIYNIQAKEFKMSYGSEINEITVATSDSGQAVDAVVALAGTGAAYAFMVLAALIFAPAAVMMAM